MGTLVIGGVLFIGVIFAQYYNWLILFPTCGLAAVLVLANPEHIDHGFPGLFFQIIAVTTSLQLGYAVGILARNFQRALNRSKNASIHSPGETVSRGPLPRKSGGRAG